MSEPTDPQHTTPPKRTRSPRGQSKQATHKAEENTPTPPLAASDQNDQHKPTQPEPATPPRYIKTTLSPSAPRTKKPKQQTAPPSQPASYDREGWKTYWAALDQSWRTEPEIDAAQQRFLTERRSIKPDIETGVYPFKDLKLRRADVEWLLATHEDGRGPVDWKDESQRDRKGIDLRGAELRNLDLRGLPLTQVRCGLSWRDLMNIPGAYTRHELRRAKWPEEILKQCFRAAAHLEDVDLWHVHLEGADLIGAHLEHVSLSSAHLERAEMRWSRLKHTSLIDAHLEGAYFIEADLEQVDLRGAFFDSATKLDWLFGGAGASNTVLLRDMRWGEVNLAVVEWSRVQLLGDEHAARQKEVDRVKPQKATKLDEFEAAVRANRQLAIALRSQGLTEVADRFSYRAQMCQRVVLRKQRKSLKYLGSWLLWLIAGYGYRPLRTLLIYLTLICGFAIVYFFLGPTVHVPLSPLGAIVFSVTSFHGRGFFPGGSPGHSITLDDPLTVAAALEAVVGLLIEISFIATFTQRFFAR